MSKWANLDEWSGLVDGSGCPICRDGKPHSIVAELDTAYVTAGEEAALKGACAVFYKRHVVELHELSPDEAAAFIHDVQKISRAVQKITGAVKMNYEIHGNTIPHLHMHLFPRYIGDRFEDQPINPRITTPPAYAAGGFDEFARKLKEAL